MDIIPTCRKLGLVPSSDTEARKRVGGGNPFGHQLEAAPPL